MIWLFTHVVVVIGWRRPLLLAELGLRHILRWRWWAVCNDLKQDTLRHKDQLPSITRPVLRTGTSRRPFADDKDLPTVQACPGSRNMSYQGLADSIQVSDQSLHSGSALNYPDGSQSQRVDTRL
ncbi:hypothetical protein BC827DRAFT_1232324 [Russula dissimulans]|nr:hypothetical protein BC827DRAFT_1232324 [Russula dissimulans]